VRRPEIELAALAEILPLSLIQTVLCETEREAKRVRKLPPELVTWLVIGMGLFRSLSIPNVLQRIVDGLEDVVRWGPAERPHSTSIAHARDRLGWEAVRVLFRKLAARLDIKHSVATAWRGLPVYAVDGTTFMTPDSDENSACFGRPGASRGGRSGFPQLRSVMVLGAWTHSVVAAVFGPYSMGEFSLATYLLPQLRSGALYLLDRGYSSWVWPARLEQRGLFFVIRLRQGRCAVKPKKLRRLGKGDWLCELSPLSYNTRRLHAAENLPTAIRIRVVMCPRKGFRPYPVMTNLLDQTRYPAHEIAVLYRDRWEVELGYRELKIHMAKERVTFRSKKPERVLQEAYGLLIAYNCVRALMSDAAAEAGVSALQLSFVDCLWRVRWWLALPGNARSLVSELALCRLPPRRKGRRCDRAVKIKMSNYPRKRHGQKSAPTRYQRQSQARQWRASEA
jgi:hypothetical protein